MPHYIRYNFFAIGLSITIIAISTLAFNYWFTPSHPIETIWSSATLIIVFSIFGFFNYRGLKPHTVKQWSLVLIAAVGCTVLFIISSSIVLLLISQLLFKTSQA